MKGSLPLELGSVERSACRRLSLSPQFSGRSSKTQYDLDEPVSRANEENAFSGIQVRDTDVSSDPENQYREYAENHASQPSDERAREDDSVHLRKSASEVV